MNIFERLYETIDKGYINDPNGSIKTFILCMCIIMAIFGCMYYTGELLKKYISYKRKKNMRIKKALKLLEQQEHRQLEEKRIKKQIRIF